MIWTLIVIFKLGYGSNITYDFTVEASCTAAKTIFYNGPNKSLDQAVLTASCIPMKDRK